MEREVLRFLHWNQMLGQLFTPAKLILFGLLVSCFILLRSNFKVEFILFIWILARRVSGEFPSLVIQDFQEKECRNC